MPPVRSVSRRPLPGAALPAPQRAARGELEHRRADIDHLDRVLVRLLNLRARLALRAAALKRQVGVPLHAPQREHEVLEKIAGANLGPLERRAVLAVFRTIIRESRRLEQDRFGTRS